ncbi:hypothetical protein AVEN_141874-1 [Araneus ventricosus]|uniref:PiggyBac transposable element-derived protein domain-containing protein n=1 Tax=Araneus ventricosus TaxID=182803 RepID=A0A4Y2GA66_ARAVE|nr:hypothetical protein AVEN_141874-1 [Araneus ventricosus]
MCNTQEVLEPYSSKVLKHDNITLMEYQEEKNKNILLLSIFHPTLEAECNEKNTPKVIKFYNSTEYGADVLEQILMSCSSKTATLSDFTPSKDDGPIALSKKLKAMSNQ